MMALDESGGEMLNVTVAGVPPKVTVGQQVALVELEGAIPWATNGKKRRGVPREGDSAGVRVWPEGRLTPVTVAQRPGTAVDTGSPWLGSGAWSAATGCACLSTWLELPTNDLILLSEALPTRAARSRPCPPPLTSRNPANAS